MDQNQKKWKRHYILRTLILSGFVLLLAEMIFTGRLSQYLAPRLHMLIYVTLGILIILTIASIRQVIIGQSDYDCDCDAHKIPRSPWTSLIVYGLFCLPLAMGIFMPDKTLGSAMAENLGVNLLSNDVRKLAQVNASVPKVESQGEDVKQNASPEGGEQLEEEARKQEEPSDTTEEPAKSVPLEDAQIRQLFAESDFGDFYTDIAVFLYKQPVIKLDDKVFLDGLTTMELYAKEFAGKEIETMGFVYHQSDFSEEQFVVARFSVSCCTADASVFGILVEDKQAKNYPIDSWVKVRGKLELRNADGYDMLVLKATQVEPVDAPKDPYVYYSFEAPQGSE